MGFITDEKPEAQTGRQLAIGGTRTGFESGPRS